MSSGSGNLRHLLVGIEKKLKALLDQRGYDECTYAPIDVPKICEIQESLRPDLNMLLTAHAVFLVDRFGLKDVCQWSSYARDALKDTRAIDLDRPGPHGRRLLTAQKRTTAWIERLDREFFWLWEAVPSRCDAIAGFVLQDDRTVDGIMGNAAKYLSALTHGQCDSFSSAFYNQRLPEMAEAIYACLGNQYDLTYEFERWFFQGQQTIRTPADIITAGRGTCLDLVILYLRCLANADLVPVFVHLIDRGEGHALAGVRLSPRPSNKTGCRQIPWGEFQDLLSVGAILTIECTGCAKGFPGREKTMDFSQACRSAREQINQSTFHFAVNLGG
jgi:hypothetical protein